ncbi:MAG TPA: hypothetical protein VGM88_03020 [Kofleriaceae bacterium]|jgi:hypothetical protein
MRAALVAVLLLAGCHRSASSRAELIDRNWLDVWPTSDRDHLHVYRFTPAMGGGVFQDRTLYKGTFELFRFDAKADEIVFDLLETHEHVRSHYTIESVDGPKPFDRKLTIDHDPRGPGVYFTSKDAAVVDARLAALPH